MTNPNLFIVGAPKAGTTSLARSLACHPAIFLPSVKEPHYFGSDTTCDVRDYGALYQRAEAYRVRVDASTHTLSSRDAIAQIVAACNDPHFVAVFRHPVDAVPALFQQFRKHLAEPAATLALAWAAQEARAEGTATGPVYRRFYDYGRQVETILRYVAPDRIRFYAFADLHDNGQTVLHDIQQFVGVAPVALSMLHENSNEQIKYHELHRMRVASSRAAGKLKDRLGIHRNFGLLRKSFGFTTSKAKRPEVPTDLRLAISTSFESELKYFFDLTGIDLGKTH